MYNTLLFFTKGIIHGNYIRRLRYGSCRGRHSNPRRILPSCRKLPIRGRLLQLEELCELQRCDAVVPQQWRHHDPWRPLCRPHSQHWVRWGLWPLEVFEAIYSWIVLFQDDYQNIDFWKNMTYSFFILIFFFCDWAQSFTTEIAIADDYVFVKPVINRDGRKCFPTLTRTVEVGKRVIRFVPVSSTVLH